MMGRIEIGLTPKRLVDEVSKVLQQIPEQSIEKAVQAAADEDDPNKKIVIAAQTLLQECLPQALAIAVHANNEKLAQGLDALTSEIRDAIRRFR